MKRNSYNKVFKSVSKITMQFLFMIFLVQNLSIAAVIKQQVRFAPNNISTWIWNTGVFNQDLRTTNTPGFEWPKGSGIFALFTSGLSIEANVNGRLRMGNASYSGEYAPGYVGDSNGLPVFKTDSRFKIYSVRIGDTQTNNPDVILWRDMIPYGAPYNDMNNNRIYDIGIDKPGVPDADQTIFVCLTDADASNHTTSEGFSGGTKPLNAEVHLTAWGYSEAPLQDFHFLRYTVINKNDSAWNGAYFGFYSDPDLGYAKDDYVGCDTALQMIYCYNADSIDGYGNIYGVPGQYGINPPAVGQTLLRGAINKHTTPFDSLKMTTGTRISKSYYPCDQDPSSDPHQAYNYFRGFKADGTPWLNPLNTPYQVTKFTFTGNPEDSTGWTENKGHILNCGGSLTGNVEVSPPGDKRMLMSSGAENLLVQPGDTQKIVISQLIARGSSNVNSVTKLKELSSTVRQIYYAIETETEPVYEPPAEVPLNYLLHQNYPNPFNPVTTIKYEVKMLWKVKIQVYDTRGELIRTLVNEEKPQGVYEVKFDASNLPSGIYFIKMTSAQGFEASKKMVLLK
ncbi:MAG: T9SS type A sorting domain-containing protein [Bacteroidetes bacterium]|nr:T9SS type A sorting domain-containing protein [Bacteroidota bacterium]